MGCHSSEQDAHDQVAAIHANEGNKMTETYSHLARVAPLSAATEASLIRLREIGIEPGDNLFQFRAEISNSLLDSHYTVMSAKTLNNYVRDANRGVSFLRSHNWRELPVGYSLSAALEVVGDKQRVVADFYTVRGLEDTDNLIRRIETGLLRDVSVGFSGGDIICNVCGSGLFECRHYPGIKYEEKVNGISTMKVATFTIDDAGLNEVSGVFDGSTPDAMILKAERAARAGELTPEMVEVIQNTYRVRLPVRSSFALGSTADKTKSQGEEDMGLEALRTALSVQTDEEVEPAVVNLVQRNKALEAQAADGVTYRNDLVTQALAEGVRAQGNDFNKTLYEETLRTASLTVIKQMRDDWKKAADAKLKGGRHSVDTTSDEKQEKKKVQLRPAGAFK
jgi:hypothetical protein